MAEKKPSTVTRPNLILDSIEPLLMQKVSQESPQHQKGNTMEA